MNRKNTRIFTIILSALMAANTCAASTAYAALSANYLNKKMAESDAATSDAQPDSGLAELADLKEKLTKKIDTTSTPASPEPTADNTLTVNPNNSLSDKLAELIAAKNQKESDVESTATENNLEASNNGNNSPNNITSLEELTAYLSSKSNKIKEIAKSDKDPETDPADLSLKELTDLKEKLTPKIDTNVAPISLDTGATGKSLIEKMKESIKSRNQALSIIESPSMEMVQKPSDQSDLEQQIEAERQKLKETVDKVTVPISDKQKIEAEHSILKEMIDEICVSDLFNSESPNQQLGEKSHFPLEQSRILS